MILAPWRQTINWLWQHSPHRYVRKRNLNFITIHYLYIISMSIVGSILLYPAGNLAYIDALFFASGCSTQSGLNTVNLNALSTYQQIIIYLIPMFCTPIVIHSFVVFVRLYWFERRFQHIVKEARSLRRTRTRTQPREDQDREKLEGDVRSKNIVVLHKGEHPASLMKDAQTDGEKADHSESTSGSSEARKPEHPPLHKTRDITFADEVEDKETLMIAQHLSPEQHIAFRENQKNPKDRSALRIPGPRDFDRGEEPQALESDEDEHNNNNEGTHGPSLNRRSLTWDNTSIAARPCTDTNHTLQSPTHIKHSHAFNNAATEEVMPHTFKSKGRTGTFTSLKQWASRENEAVAPYLSWQPTIGRNSAFVDLTERQREELGGIEYRSLKTLAAVLVSYYLLFQIIAVIVFVPWIIRTSPWNGVVDSNNVSRGWWGVFTPASMFNDVGFTLTSDSMQSFQLAVLPLLLGSYLIVVGNTGFPCNLRFVIWVLSKVVRTGSGIWEELRFLLDHPRRCFTLLFPANATWWLFWVLVILNGLDVIFFIILDIHDDAVDSINPAGYRVLNGLFQATSTRTAGFASVNLAELHPAIQVSYMIMMYISVFPIAISMRRTNVYEEKSLGIYAGDRLNDDKEPSYVGAHLRNQLSFDLWYIFLGLFIIAIVEADRLENTRDYAFTLYSILFEIVSAYGTVGLSLGYPNYDPSLSGQFKTISKLVIIAMQIRGRHRGLPYGLDRAVLLPSDKLNQKDEIAGRYVQRRNSSMSNIDSPSHLATSPTSDHNLRQRQLTHEAIDTTAETSGYDGTGDKDTNSGIGAMRRGVGSFLEGVRHPLRTLREDHDQESV